MSRPSSWYSSDGGAHSSSYHLDDSLALPLFAAPGDRLLPRIPSSSVASVPGAIGRPPLANLPPPPSSSLSSPARSSVDQRYRRPSSHPPRSPPESSSSYQHHAAPPSSRHAPPTSSSDHPQLAPMSSAFSLSRSASLGGPRRPQVDDVERGMMDSSSDNLAGSPNRGGGGGAAYLFSSGSSGNRWLADDPEGQHQNQKHQQSALQQARHGHSNSVSSPYPNSGGGEGNPSRSLAGQQQQQPTMNVGEVYPSTMTGQGLERTGLTRGGGGSVQSGAGAPPGSPHHGPPRAGDHHLAQQQPRSSSMAASQERRLSGLGPLPPAIAGSYQSQQHQLHGGGQHQQHSQQQQQQNYTLGHPHPPSSNPYLPTSSQQHASPYSTPNSTSSPNASSMGVAGGPGPPPPPGWGAYNPHSTPQIEMQSSPHPQPPPSVHSLSFRATSGGHLSASSSPKPTATSFSNSSNPYGPASGQPHPPPLASSSSQQQHSHSLHQPPHHSSYPYPSSPAHHDSLPPPTTAAGGGSSYSRLTPSPSSMNPHGHYAPYSPRSSRDAMQVDQGPPKAKAGFRKVSDIRDLRPVLNRTRSGDLSAGPLASLTTHLARTYSQCNPKFRYEVAHNPRRVLTKPSNGVLNDGYDNEDNDYILYVNDMLGTESGHKYLILDVLGQGTFGQVVKCQNMKTNEIVAVKVVKNKPAYFNQSMMEVAILEELNQKADPHDKHNILRMRTNFIHHKHLCLVFECLSSNLYELIKQNSFRGLSTQLVKVFTTQLLDTLTVLHEQRLIHCDLKPENILLKSLQSPHIKVIDFGSACHEYNTVYTYIQSRFYRSPEVLLGLPYSTAIDMWSLGCIAVELFLGLPLFPGTSEYNQLSRIIDMLGMPPNHLLDNGKQVHEFFNILPNPDPYGRGKIYRLKSMEQYSKEHNVQEQPSKQYFKASTLPEIIRTYQFGKRNAKQADIDKEMAIRASFTDFVLGLLNLDPIKRWSPQQAMQHPFITGEKGTGSTDPVKNPAAIAPPPVAPPPQQQQQPQQQQPQQPDSKRPYGGLVVNTTSRQPRAYADAATYNQQLAQHQTFTAQQQAAQQAANAYRHPFAPPPGDEASGGAYNGAQQQQRSAVAAYQTQQQQSQQQQQAAHAQAQAQAHAQAVHHQQQQHQRMASNSTVAASSPYSIRNSVGSILPPPAAAHSSGPSGVGGGGGASGGGGGGYYPATGGGRNRANTIGQLDFIPPHLNRLASLGVDPTGGAGGGAGGGPGGRSALTPQMANREEMMREWERRQQQQQQGAAGLGGPGGTPGKRTSGQTWHQLEHLEAESLGWPKPSTRGQQNQSHHLQLQQPPPSSSSSTQQQQSGYGYPNPPPMSIYPPPPSISSSDAAAGVATSPYALSPTSPSRPPQAYAAQGRPYRTSAVAYDALGGGDDFGLGSLISPLLPSQASSGSSSSAGGGGGGGGYGGGGQQQSPSALQPGQRNPFAGPEGGRR